MKSPNTPSDGAKRGTPQSSNTSKASGKVSASDSSRVLEPKTRPKGAYAALKSAKPDGTAGKTAAQSPTNRIVGSEAARHTGSERDHVLAHDAGKAYRQRQQLRGDAQRSVRAAARQQPETTPAPAVRHLIVAEQYADQRLDNYLLRELKGAPKSLVYRILRSGEVRVDGKRAKPDQRLKGGEDLRIPPLRLSQSSAPAVDADQLAWLEAQILFEDKSLLVLNKPSGLASHGGSGLSFGAIEALRKLRPLAELELVHRLDRDTSGILLIAKKRSQLKLLQTAMRDGEVTKRYLALVKDLPANDHFKANFALRKNELASGERVVKVDSEGKASLTFFRVQQRFADCALVQAELGSGRTHQIRVHAQALEHPLAGDQKYGDEAFNALMQSRGLKRLFLHAASVAWKQDGELISYTCPLPADLSRIIDALGASQ